ncbi:hypothetical protein GDO86_009039 [Hymenochirus boettgeri]|uniref:Transcriptional regulating factor 1 n=1 Tax=Hymenochirus boettgeri TaxID=247094 RepID=A0A8T2JJH6_9PIPI|nr:hypothetical protein GDO86_009039 [Hymenochirus boettgeri]
MEARQLFTTHLSDDEHLFYQQLQSEANSHALNHNYDALDINDSESSSSSPHLPQHSRDMTESSRPGELARPGHWSHAESGSVNHIQARSHLNSCDQGLTWNSQSQNEVTESFQVPYFSQQKMTHNPSQKLDSFSQVFARQNLKMNSTSQGVHERPSTVDSDSALRQLLSLKPENEPESLCTATDQYQQPPQQSLANPQQKHQLPHFYYEYTQHVTHMQAQPLMQQEQHYFQQMQPQQVSSQQAQHCYLQASQPRQQCSRGQFSGHMSQYCQGQAAGLEVPHTVQPSLHHQMQLQGPPHPRDRSQKTEYKQEGQAHTVPVIQLSSAPHYVYQNSQPFRNLYKQESSHQKSYSNENRSQMVMDPSVGITTANSVDGYNNRDVGAIGISVPHHPAMQQDNLFMVNRDPVQTPHSAWSQINSDGHLTTVTSEHRDVYERPDSKNQLICSMCFKEFRSQPALNGHLRSHGGVKPLLSFKQEGAEKQGVSKVDNIPPIVMPVSVPVTLPLCEPSLKARCIKDKDQHQSSVSDAEMPVLTSSPKTVSSRASSEIINKLHQGKIKLDNAEESVRSHQERKKNRHRPEPLFIPPPFFNNALHTGGATLYQSQLRSPRILGDNLLIRTLDPPTYTPPPMLSPVRQGSGLFSSVVTAVHNAHLPLTPLTPTPRVLLGQPNSIDGDNTTITPGPGEQTIDVEPTINIGSRFQAEIPELQDPSSQETELHKATLVWKPWPDLENIDSQQRLDNFLRMSCSSVLPGGGTNQEYAFHTLFVTKGNIMNALEMLLLNKQPRLNSHQLANYHYAGSDKWTFTEKKMFNKALITCNKDFFHMQKMIKSKTVSQCVEYYYTWKNILHFGNRHRARLVNINQNDTICAAGDLDEDERKYENDLDHLHKSPGLQHVLNLGRPTVENSLTAGSFVCEMGNCGAVFCSRQALNGHARIHRGCVPGRVYTVPTATRPKSSNQSGYCSVKSSQAHSKTSGETDTASIFPCKVCGKVFFKIKSRNAHMKTHRQQEEQQRQKAQNAAVATDMADSIARTVVPADHISCFDNLILVKDLESDFDNDVAQDLVYVLEKSNIMDADLLLDEGHADLLHDGAVL